MLTTRGPLGIITPDVTLGPNDSQMCPAYLVVVSPQRQPPSITSLPAHTCYFSIDRQSLPLHPFDSELLWDCSKEHGRNGIVPAFFFLKGRHKCIYKCK